MSNVINLAAYRAARARRDRLPMTERAAFDLANASHVVNAETGHELAGCPTAQIIQGAPAGKAFWARLHAGSWFYVANSDVAWQAGKGWHLQKVRLVTPMKQEG